MPVTRRTALRLAAAAPLAPTLARTLATTVARTAVPALVPTVAAARPARNHSHPLAGGRLVVTPVSHASLVLEAGGGAIYADPVGGGGAYAGLPPPDLLLVTHEHTDHFDPATILELIQPHTRLLTNPAVRARLPNGIRGRAYVLENGSAAELGGMPIEAVPAYNTTPERLSFHPKGRDNGYVLTLGGRRIYIAGDTEDTPELRALSDIHIAFLPMELPATMSTGQAAAAVAAFRPDIVYPYQHQGQDPAAFAAAVKASGAPSEVVIADWYG